MRHKVQLKRFNRKKGHRVALLRSLVTSLILYESIETTRDKAKAARGIVDRMITRAKNKDTMNAIRYLNKHLLDKKASMKVMDVLTKRYSDRSSGFTRFVNTRKRIGDNSQLVQFLLI